MTAVRVFVAGATGYTGREVVRACAEQGAETVAHVRPDSPSRAEWEGRFAAMRVRADATPWEPQAMRATLAALRPTLVFALLGTTQARSRRAARTTGRTETYETVDYGLTHLLLEAARQAARDTGGRPRFVYLSAVGAREDTRNAYLQVRGRLERELRESGLPWLVARPAFITGSDRDERRPLERGTAVVMNAFLGALGVLGARRLRDRYRSLTGRELGAGLVRVALAERGEGRVVGGEVVRG